MQRSNNYYLKRIAEITTSTEEPSFEFNKDNAVVGHNLSNNSYAVVTEGRVADFITPNNPQTESEGFVVVQIYKTTNLQLLKQLMGGYSSELAVLLEINPSIFEYVTSLGA